MPQVLLHDEYDMLSLDTAQLALANQMAQRKKFLLEKPFFSPSLHLAASLHLHTNEITRFYLSPKPHRKPGQWMEPIHVTSNITYFLKL